MPLYCLKENKLLLKIYYTNRTQDLQVNKCTNFMGSVRYGVLQESGIDQLLSSIYINDIKDLI